ncbi:MAG: hypothetical protein HY717_05575 [Planctomycetes bacterium]|nr:hypothetical protein [Planctomycetota bacterium]
MLARQMTADLQAIRDRTGPGRSNLLITKRISFGMITRDAGGKWDISRVEGLPSSSLATTGPNDPPSLIIRPFHQAGAVVSLREFTNNAFNHHHGIQSAERFGADADTDGDGFVSELTRADVTAAVIFQATLPVPGRVIPNHPAIEEAVRVGEERFQDIGCTHCHVPSLPLENRGWIFAEPNPFNPPGNLRPGDASSLEVNLNADNLPPPRLEAQQGVVQVPAFTDLKLHDISGDSGDPGDEPLDMTMPADSEAFFAGNRRFITRKLWGFANEPPFFHHGKFTTIRQAVLAHAGEALAARQNFEALSEEERDSIIEFLKTLQVLPPGTRSLVVDENGQRKQWPPPPPKEVRGNGQEAPPSAPREGTSGI